MEQTERKRNNQINRKMKKKNKQIFQQISETSLSTKNCQTTTSFIHFLNGDIYHLPSIDHHFPIGDALKLQPYFVHLGTPHRCAHLDP